MGPDRERSAARDWRNIQLALASHTFMIKVCELALGFIVFTWAGKLTRQWEVDKTGIQIGAAFAKDCSALTSLSTALSAPSPIKHLLSI